MVECEIGEARQLTAVNGLLMLSSRRGWHPFWSHQAAGRRRPARSSGRKRFFRAVRLEDLTGAARELKGEVAERKANSVPWDHGNEVRETQNRLVEIVGRINNKLVYPKTDDAERELLVADLGRASGMLDYSAHYVPR